MFQSNNAVILLIYFINSLAGYRISGILKQFFLRSLKTMLSVSTSNVGEKTNGIIISYTLHITFFFFFWSQGSLAYSLYPLHSKISQWYTWLRIFVLLSFIMLGILWSFHLEKHLPVIENFLLSSGILIWLRWWTSWTESNFLK